MRSKILQVERLKELLRELEWSGTVVFDEWYDKGKCCPKCRGTEEEGHEGSCKLAEALYEEG